MASAIRRTHSPTADPPRPVPDVPPPAVAPLSPARDALPPVSRTAASQAGQAIQVQASGMISGTPASLGPSSPE